MIKPTYEKYLAALENIVNYYWSISVNFKTFDILTVCNYGMNEPIAITKRKCSLIYELYLHIIIYYVYMSENL